MKQIYKKEWKCLKIRPFNLKTTDFDLTFSLYI